MDFGMFMEKAEKILDYMPEEYKDSSVSIREECKVNCVKRALSVSAPDRDNIAATIYIEDLYRCYQECGDIDAVFSQAAKKLARSLENLPEQAINFDYSKFRDNVIMVLVNSSENEEMLQNVPSRPFHDLSIVFRWVLSYDDEGIRSVLVSNELVRLAGISAEELFLCAVKNTKRLFPVKTYIMEQSLLEKEKSREPGEPCSDGGHMWVISNEYGTNGAVSVFYEENLYNLAEREGTDLYVIPSSVHEMLAVSVDTCTPQRLSELIWYVNQCHVVPEDRLSNSVYYYNKNLRALMLLADSKKKLVYKSE